MKEHYGTKGYSLDPNFHLSQTDNEVLSAMRKAAHDLGLPGAASARAILNRGHFRRVYARNPSDEAMTEDAIKNGSITPFKEQSDFSPAYFLKERLSSEFGSQHFRYDKYFQGGNASMFPVLMSDNRIEASIDLSEVIRNIPLTKVTYVFADPAVVDSATSWIERNRVSVLSGGLND